MKKMILLLSLFLNHSLYASLPVVNAAPPSLPSSSVAFAKIATSPTSITNPQSLPCFKAYDQLYKLVYPNQNSSNVQLLITQGSNQTFIQQQTALIKNAQINTSTFNN